MAALFTSGSSSRDSGNNLVEFKAGKMFMRGKMVHPDKRKGLFYIHKEKENMLTHVCWKDRTSGVVEDDLIVFPDDCEFKRVNKCSTGRVFLLTFQSNKKKLFFWMQEPKTDKDDEYEKKVNKLLNDQGDSNEMLSGELSQLASVIGPQEQLFQQLFRGQGLGSLGALSSNFSRQSERSNNETEETATSTARTSTFTSVPDAPVLQVSDLNAIMSNLAPVSASSESNNQANSADSPEEKPNEKKEEAEKDNQDKMDTD